jgi:hypothetical protein
MITVPYDVLQKKKEERNGKYSLYSKEKLIDTSRYVT